jgi:outer membrane protein TolC
LKNFIRALIIGSVLLCTAPLLAGEREKEQVYMSLYEVLSLAVANNFDVQLNMYDNKIYQTNLDLAKSVFDSSITFTGDYEYDKSKKPNIILGQSSHTGSAGATLTKKLITGTDLSLSFDNQRMSSDSAFSTLNPYYESVVEMKFVQPLLKNFFGMNDYGEVRITRIEVHNFNLETLDKIEANIADVEKAYWNAAIAVELVKVGEDMYERAQDFYEINKKKRDIGTSEEADLLSAEANMERRSTELEIERNNLKNAVNDLKFLINHPDIEEDILPADPVEYSVWNADLSDSLERAFKGRRDYESAKEDVKAKDLDFDLKRNARWPELDLEGSLALNGLGPVYDNAAARAFTKENPVFKTTMTFTIPLEDGLGRSEYDAAKYEKAKALLELKKTEKTIVTEIDESVRGVNLNKSTADQRIKIENIQKKKLTAEEKQFAIGRSNSDTIVRFQEDLLQARLAALRAIKNYKDALVDLYVTEDSYLDERRLTIK